MPRPLGHRGHIEIFEVDRHGSSRSIDQELKIKHRIVLNHLHKCGFKKKLDVWVPHQLPKNMMDRISSSNALAKRNKIDPFLKRMVTRDVKNGSHTTTLSKSDRGQSVVKQLQR
ncbi:histone-lysine N-methyltransferase SETMAR [Trichonephila clavata]|uniref:Histone-lysine N-methyltransferase SETMAR n=1 Tax=Trichonephila clavata TaxID=2740835 RepID=A0A8X6HMB5_TRICU|nr:histone-lysine N-methyltransferase SETMAR [Trichonephila clavata]